MTMLADHAARQLLDFSQKLDINLLDNVVNCLYHGEGAQVVMLCLSITVCINYIKQWYSFLLLAVNQLSTWRLTLSRRCTVNIDGNILSSLVL